MFKIISWNCNSLLYPPHFFEINSLLSSSSSSSSSSSPDILLLTEAKISEQFTINDSNVHVNHYNHFCFPFTSRSSGIVIYVKNHINVYHEENFSLSSQQKQQLSYPSMLEWIRVKYENQSFLVGCIYIHPYMTDADWLIISAGIGRALSSGSEFYLLGDFNARHVFWYDTLNNTNGMRMRKLLLENDHLSVLNMIYARGISTHEQSHSILDLCITNTQHAVNNFVVDAELMLHSDHMPIVLSLNYTANRPLCMRNLWILDPIKTKCFQEMLDILFHERNIFACNDDIITKANKWGESITQRLLLAARLSFKQKIVSNKQKTKRVVSDERLTQLLNNYHRIHHYKNRHQTPEAHAQYQTAKNELNAYLQVVRARQHQRLLDDLEDKKHNVVWATWSKITKPIRNFPFIKHNDTLLSEQNSLDILCEHFAKTFQSHPVEEVKGSYMYQDIYQEVRIFMRRLEGVEEKELKWSLLETEFKRLCEKQDLKSEGLDRIPYFFVKNGSDAFFHELFLLYEFLYKNAIFPDAWKISKVVPIYKKKGSTFSPNNYRPISVTSVFARLYEVIMLQELHRVIDPNLTLSQVGFKEKHGTLEHIFVLKQAVKFAIENKSFLPVAFIDFEKAFDSVRHDFLLYKLHQMGVDFGMLRLLLSFLTHRKFSVVFNFTQSKMMDAEAGVPQGAMSSPILFNSFIDDVCKYEINRFRIGIGKECVGMMYADDGCLLPIRIGEPAIPILKQALYQLSEWARCWGMKISIDKTNVVVFTNQINLPVMDFKVGSQQLAIVDSYKYLGITFEKNGTFETHEMNLMRKLDIIKFYVLKLFKPNTYVSPFAIRNILKAVVMPCVTYGIALWKYDEAFANQLDQYITTIFRMTVRAPTTTSHDALYLEFHMLSIQYYQQYFLALFILQLLKFGDEPTLATMCYENELFQLEVQDIPQCMMPREHSSLHISQERARQHMAAQQRKQQKHPSSIRDQLEIKVIMMVKRNLIVNHIWINCF